MKKVVSILIVVASLFALSGCFKKEENKPSDALKFKEEYESLNNKENATGKKYREVSIPDDNPFVYASAKDIVDLINNKETFAVYFGFNSCPWCRSVIETLIQVAKDLKLEKIYYVDVKDIRDTYTLSSGKPVLEEEGKEGYSDLIKALDNVLSEYTLNDDNGKVVNVGEKRIYAPNIISVIDGVPQKLTSAISKLQTDSYMELSDEMKTEMYDNINCVLDCLEKKVCTVGC